MFCFTKFNRRYPRLKYLLVLLLVVNASYLRCVKEKTLLSIIEPNSLQTYATISNFSNGIFPLNIYNQSSYRLYVDIGCFNGDSIEQFIHFTPDSLYYDIFTFEPDPENYHSCKKRLQGERFRKHNIFLIPKVVWIKDEKVRYRINKGIESRIETDVNSTIFTTTLDAIDFSAWLSRILVKSKTILRLKVSMPDAEVMVLEKLLVDELLGLAERVDVEWTDRKKPHLRAKRIYIQSSLDGLGFSLASMIRPSEAQKVVEQNGNWARVPKHYDWTKIPESDTISIYIQRPTVTDPPRTKRKSP